MDPKSRKIVCITNGMCIYIGLCYSGLYYFTRTGKATPLINKTFDSILYGSGIALSLIPLVLGVKLLKG